VTSRAHVFGRVYLLVSTNFYETANCLIKMETMKSSFSVDKRALSRIPN